MKVPSITIRLPQLPSFRTPRMPIFHNPLTRKVPRSRWFYRAGLAIFVALAGIFFAFIFTHPDIRVGADSGTYLSVADAVRHGASNVALLTFGMNLLGPVAIAIALNNNTILIAAFNLILYLWNVRIARVLDFNYCLFALLLALNPETLASVVTLNKEVLATLGFTLLIQYEYSDKHPKWLLTLSMLFSMMARWEQAAIGFIFIALRRGSFRRHPYLSLFMVAAGISVTYPTLMHHVDLSAFAAEASGAGLILQLDNLQAHGGFLVVFIPKLLMQTFGRLVTPWYFFHDYWKEDFTDWQNQFFINLHAIAILLLAIWLAFKRKFNLRDPIPFLVALYMIVSASNTFVMPRYGYPSYALMALEAARPNLDRKRL